MSDLCKVEFPPGMVVHGRDPEKKNKRGKPLHVVQAPANGSGIIVEGVPREKALKHAFVVGAKVTDGEGNVLAAPQVEVQDKRQDALEVQAKKQADRIDELERALAELQAAKKPAPKRAAKR